MNIPANTTPQEFASYYCTDSNAAEYLMKALDAQREAQDDLKQIEKRMEIIEEQLGFAQDLIEGIQAVCKGSTRAKDIKQGVQRLIDDSYFEL